MKSLIGNQDEFSEKNLNVNKFLLLFMFRELDFFIDFLFRSNSMLLKKAGIVLYIFHIYLRSFSTS